MMTATDIRRELREARQRGRNLYLLPVDRKAGHGIRITHARTYNNETQVLTLGTGEWFTVVPGDVIYTN